MHSEVRTISKLLDLKLPLFESLSPASRVFFPLEALHLLPQEDQGVRGGKGYGSVGWRGVMWRGEARREMGWDGMRGMAAHRQRIGLR